MKGSIRRLCRAAAVVCVTAYAPIAFAQTAAPAQKPDQKPADTALPSARSIVDRHIEASGGRKAMAAHKSHRVRGTMSVPAQGISGNLELVAARPNKARMRVTIAGVGEMEEGFDGERGWILSAMTGPMLSTGAELEERKFHSDFDADLRDESRYEYIKTVEKTTFEGRPVYKLALKRKGGTTEDFEYYDVETGLRAGSESTRNTMMGAMSVTTTLSDYKKFGDVMFPTVMKQKAMGVEQVFTIASVEHDVVDEAAFEMPAAVKALIK